jgi:hypothetical protein
MRNSDEKEIERLHSRFVTTTKVVHTLVGQAAFRITDPTGHRIEPAVNRALFDAQMLGSRWVTTDLEDIDVAKVRRELAGLFSSETFLDAIQRATGDRSRTLRRIRETVGALERAGVRLEVPFDLSR